MDSSPNDFGKDEHSAATDSARKQLVLYHLSESNGEVPLEELSRKIAASEADRTTASVDDDAVASVYATLYRTHVPELTDSGIIRYDDEDDAIQATDRLDAFHNERGQSRNDHRRGFLYYAIPAAVLTGAVLVLEFGDVAAPDSGLLWVTIAGAATLLLVALIRYTNSERTARSS